MKIEGRKSKVEGRTAAQWTLPIETSAGTFTATFTEAGLRELNFPQSAAAPAPERRPIRNAISSSVTQSVPHWAAITQSAVEEVLRGHDPRELPPFDWSGASDFQRRVWTALQKIAAGQTRSYSEIAESVGSPGAARAVGSACGANPIPVLVPCHRVLASGGSLGGFSGGLGWKRRLLSAEGVEAK